MSPLTSKISGQPLLGVVLFMCFGVLCILQKSIFLKFFGVIFILFGIWVLKAIIYRKIQAKKDPEGARKFAEQREAALEAISDEQNGTHVLYDHWLEAQRQRAEIVANYAREAGWVSVIANDSTFGMYVPDTLKAENAQHTYAMSYNFNSSQMSVHTFQYNQYVAIPKSVDINNHQDQALLQQYGTIPLSTIVVAVDVNKPLSKLFIGRHFLLSTLGGYHKQENLQLEGDFNKFFDVYTPLGKEQEALEILEPNLMQLMIDKGKRFDIQIMEHAVLFMSDDNFQNPPNVSELAEYADEFLEATGLNSKDS